MRCHNGNIARQNISAGRLKILWEARRHNAAAVNRVSHRIAEASNWIPRNQRNEDISISAAAHIDVTIERLDENIAAVVRRDSRALDINIMCGRDTDVTVAGRPNAKRET